MPFHRLRYQQNDERNCYYITERKSYKALMEFPEDIINRVFDFAFNMTFGQEGQHRNHRTGGRHRRENGEIFINAFQGKLAEYGLFLLLKNKGINIDEPDLQKWKLGKWDLADFQYNGKNIAVKSTKHYGNLLLLETEDWDENAVYSPSEVFYNFIFLVRLRPDGDKIMRNNKLLYKNNSDRDQLKKLILEQTWDYDIPGYITGSRLRDEVINTKRPFILPQGSYLNCRTLMDAENYYIQSGNLKPLTLAK